MNKSCKRQIRKQQEKEADKPIIKRHAGTWSFDNEGKASFNYLTYITVPISPTSGVIT